MASTQTYLTENPPVTPFWVCIRIFCLSAGLFIFLVWFWNHISSCRPPCGICGRAIQKGIRTLDLLDEAHLLTQNSLVTILCGTIAAELRCLETFYQQCLSKNEEEHKFYAALHLEASSAMLQYCGLGIKMNNEAGDLKTCWTEIRYRRGKCSTEFLNSSGGKPQVIMDSLFDDLDTGVYRKEFCWSIREAYLCGLGAVRLSCGENEAKTIYHLSTNITKMIFTEKCDVGLRPSWTDSTHKLAMASRRFLSFLSILVLCSIIAIVYFIWKIVSCAKRLRAKWRDCSFVSSSFDGLQMRM